jgi:hypothetical protein
MNKDITREEAADHVAIALHHLERCVQELKVAGLVDQDRVWCSYLLGQMTHYESDAPDDTATLDDVLDDIENERNAYPHGYYAGES